MRNGGLALERVFAEENVEHGSGVVPFGPEVRVRHRDLVPIICLGQGGGNYVRSCTSTVSIHVSKCTFIHIVCVFSVFWCVCISLSDVSAYSHSIVHLPLKHRKRQSLK